MYRFVDAAVARVAALPPDMIISPWPDLDGSTGEDVARWQHWLARVWACAAFTAAVEVASPVLARRVEEVCAGRERRVRQVRRVLVSVMRYLLRATSRATPFGLFAGVAPVRFGSAVQVCHGERHHVVARVDAVWLAKVITRLERCPRLRGRLAVVRNNVAFVRDGRWVVGCQQPPAGSARTAPEEVSVRRTRAVEVAVGAADAPIRVDELVGILAAEFPGTPQRVIEGMLGELVAQRILVTSLRPPMTATDPLAHVVGELAAVGAEAVPQVAGLVGALGRIHHELSRHNRVCCPAERRALRSSASARMAALSTGTGTAERLLGVDLRLDCALVLPQAVAREAEAAAAVLARLSPDSGGVAAWRAWHARFLDRYGVGGLVPLTELLNTEAGLGFPTGYRDARLAPPPAPGLCDRDVRLLALAQHAALEQRREVVLDEAAIAKLAVAGVAAARVAPHTELRVRVQARTRDALNRGEFTLAVAGVSRAAGTTTGRFLDLLDPADRERMRSAYAALPTVSAGALAVQVCAAPLYARTENVVRAPAVLPHLVCMAEHHTPGAGVIPLNDLAVSGDAQTLSLVWLSRGRLVEPVVFSAVEFVHAAHPLLRFLCEIPTARGTTCVPFSWGAAARLPFLPRVRYRRTILSPARWILTATDLPSPASPGPQWAPALDEWRRRSRLPDAVYLGADDRRIRLNMDEPAHLQLLRSEVDRAGHATVREAVEDSALGWFDGRFHEIVVPLAGTRAGRAPAPRRTTTAPRRTTAGPTLDRDHGHLPGASGWLYAKLSAHPDRHPALLTTHLPELLSRWEQPPQCWFLPYRDPEHHLRLRIRLPATDADAVGPATQRVGAWAAGLRRLGLIGTLQFDTYYPETGRFGPGAAMTAAESVFAADSAAAIAQLTCTTHPGAPHRYAIITASLVDLAISYLGGVGEGVRWLVKTARRPRPQPPTETCASRRSASLTPTSTGQRYARSPAGRTS